MKIMKLAAAFSVSAYCLPLLLLPTGGSAAQSLPAPARGTASAGGASVAGRAPSINMDERVSVSVHAGTEAAARKEVLQAMAAVLTEWAPPRKEGKAQGKVSGLSINVVEVKQNDTVRSVQVSATFRIRGTMPLPH